MSKKMDVELAIRERRYGALIRNLDQRINLMGKSLAYLINSQVKKVENKNSKEGAMLYFFKALRVMGVIAEWSAKALEDGKITAKEGMELVVELAKVLDLPPDIEIPVK